MQDLKLAAEAGLMWWHRKITLEVSHAMHDFFSTQILMIQTLVYDPLTAIRMMQEEREVTKQGAKNTPVKAICFFESGSTDRV